MHTSTLVAGTRVMGTKQYFYLSIQGKLIWLTDGDNSRFHSSKPFLTGRTQLTRVALQCSCSLKRHEGGTVKG